MNLKNQKKADEFLNVVAKNHKKVIHDFRYFVFKNHPEYATSIFDSDEVFQETIKRIHTAISFKGLKTARSGEAREKSFLDYFYSSLRQNIWVYNDNHRSKKGVEAKYIESTFDECELDPELQQKKMEKQVSMETLTTDIFKYVKDNFSNKEFQIFHSYFYSNYIDQQPTTRTACAKALKITQQTFSIHLENVLSKIRTEFKEETLRLLFIRKQKQ